MTAEPTTRRVTKKTAAMKQAMAKPATELFTVVEDPSTPEEVAANLQAVQAQRDELLATIEALRTDMLLMAQGMAKQAADHGSSYCEDYERVVRKVAPTLKDEQAREMFRRTAIRHWYTMEFPMEGMSPAVRVRAGSLEDAITTVGAAPWDYISTSYIQRNLRVITDPERVRLVDTEEVR